MIRVKYVSRIQSPIFFLHAIDQCKNLFICIFDAILSPLLTYFQSKKRPIQFKKGFRFNNVSDTLNTTNKVIQVNNFLYYILVNFKGAGIKFLS